MSSDIQRIAEATLDAFTNKVESMAYDTGSEIATTLKTAAKHAQGLLELAVGGGITMEELKAGLNEISETIEGVIAGEVFDGQRELLEFAKDTLKRAIPLALSMV